MSTTEQTRLKCNCGADVNACVADYAIYSNKEGNSCLRIRTRSLCGRCGEGVVHRISVELKEELPSAFVVLCDNPMVPMDEKAGVFVEITEPELRCSIGCVK
mgnify:CR=1 FL=1|jgi:hypothetical protein